MSIETTPSKGQDPANELSRGTLIAACLAACLAQAALTVPASVSGLLQTALKPVGNQLVWTSNAFLLPMVALSPAFGVWGNRLGLKRLLVGGAVLITAGESVTAAGDDVHQVWAGQAIAGVGAAALLPASLTVVTRGTGTTRARAGAFATYAAALGGGILLAQALRGAGGDDGSWRWPFALTAGLGVLSALLGQLLTRNSGSVYGRSLDVVGQLCIGVGLLALLYSVVEGGAGRWSETDVILGFLVAAVFLGLFIMVELHTPVPLLRLGLFADRAYAVSSFAAVVGMFAYSGVVYAAGIRVGIVQDQSLSHLIGAFCLLSAFAVVLLPLTSRLLEHVSSRWTLAAGLFLIAGGAFVAAGLSISDKSLGSIVLALTPVGIGFALTLASTTFAVSIAPVREAGMSSAAVSMLRNLGYTVGPAIVGGIALRHAASRLDSDLASAPLPPLAKGAVGAIADAGGPLAVNAIPQSSPAGAAHSIAFEALGRGYSLGFTVCGIAALVACLIAVVVRPGPGPGPEDNGSPRKARQTSA
ncbi:MFS transporter [Streptomyces sp. NPDC004629]|uniref:MFS transporter n=1 Tax=Streptomyces sp. NPDC004629 TaxID=3364705 RepID=UPI00367BF756